MIPEDFQREFEVSDECINRLMHYEVLLKKWTKVINLIGPSTVSQIWSRHFYESAKSFQIAKSKPGKWLDFGSGGGLPGVVVALIAEDQRADFNLVCVEADLRKCQFIRTVSRETGARVSVSSRRIEDLPAQNAQAIFSRALASLDSLLKLSENQLATDGNCFFHKGKNWRSEIAEAQKNWSFNYEVHDCGTHEESVILSIGDLKR